MSDALPENPTTAARVYVLALSFASGFECVVMIWDGRIIAGILSGAVGIALAAVDYKLKWIFDRIGPRFAQTLNSFATHAGTWIATVLVITLTVALSPYVEQNRLPFAAWFQSPPISRGHTSNPLSDLSEIIDKTGTPLWVAVAFKEYDVGRYKGAQSNPRILEYLRSIPGAQLDESVDWASAFAEWCLNQVGIGGPKDMRAKAWLTWGRETKKPRLGSVVVFNFQGTEHVGFFIAEKPNGYLSVLGGNQVDKVQVRDYMKKDLVAYREPALFPPEENLREQLSAANKKIETLESQVATLTRERDAARQAPVPALPPALTDTPRIYTKKTIAELMGFYEGRTALQGDVFMADEVGKWIVTKGAVQHIQPEAVVVIQVDRYAVTCSFDAKWKPKLVTFRSGETIKIAGKLSQQNGGSIYLQNCELRD